jgi:tRNA A37 threonylcarbamoyladenosine dehydratase
MRFERTLRLFGAPACQAFARSRVAVVGIGGVGSYAVEALARTGIGALLLVDGDVVEPSNINRQLWALDATLGRPKVAVAAERVGGINPACTCTVHQARARAGNLDDLVGGGVDGLIDAIDCVEDKLDLIEFCLRSGTPFVSCLGAAGRRDPTRVRYGALARVTGCPLAKAVRRGLRRRGVAGDVPVVYSCEAPRAIARGAPLPSCCAVPGAMGLAAAARLCERLSDLDSEVDVL